jgi:hypothetical protein
MYVVLASSFPSKVDILSAILYIGIILGFDLSWLISKRTDV